MAINVAPRIRSTQRRYRSKPTESLVSNPMQVGVNTGPTNQLSVKPPQPNNIPAPMPNINPQPGILPIVKPPPNLIGPPVTQPPGRPPVTNVADATRLNILEKNQFGQYKMPPDVIARMKSFGIRPLAEQDKNGDWWSNGDVAKPYINMFG